MLPSSWAQSTCIPTAKHSTWPKIALELLTAKSCPSQAKTLVEKLVLPVYVVSLQAFFWQASSMGKDSSSLLKLLHHGAKDRAAQSHPTELLHLPSSVDGQSLAVKSQFRFTQFEIIWKIPYSNQQ